MNRKFTAIGVVSLFACAVEAAPLERGATYKDDWGEAKAQQIANELSLLVRLRGWKCDTVSSVQLWVFSPGFDLVCNGFRYSYEIEDKGGKWTVRVK